MTQDTAGYKNSGNLIIPPHILEKMVAHCKACYPNEACGILAGTSSRASKIYTMQNIEMSPVSYMMDSKEQFRVMKDMRENNLSMLAIYHSHPSSTARPSQKDVSLAFYDDCYYVIVGMINQNPDIKAFSIKETKVEDVNITVV